LLIFFKILLFWITVFITISNSEVFFFLKISIQKNWTCGQYNFNLKSTLPFNLYNANSYSEEMVENIHFLLFIERVPDLLNILLMYALKFKWLTHGRRNANGRGGFRRRLAQRRAVWRVIIVLVLVLFQQDGRLIDQLVTPSLTELFRPAV